MRRPPANIREEIIAENSRTWRAAEKREDLVAVCLIGPSEIMARRLGDNRGARPVRIITTAKSQRTAVKDIDLAHPYAKFVVLEHVMVETRDRAERLKAALDKLLIGQQETQDNDQPRHHFRDVIGCFETDDERALWWAELLLAAQPIVLRAATQFEVYSPQAAKAKIAGAAKSFGRVRR